MAVVDKYVNSSIASNKIINAALVNGARVVGMVATEETAAADDDGSIYRFFKGVSGNLIPIEIFVYCDAITSGTDYDLGLYNQTSPGGTDGTVIDADVFMDGQTLATAISRGGGTANQNEAVDGLAAVDIADLQQKIYEHAGHTVNTAKQGYDICLTANTVGSAAGTITIIAIFIEG
jgi:hypothetical protein